MPLPIHACQRHLLGRVGALVLLVAVLGSCATNGADSAESEHPANTVGTTLSAEKPAGSPVAGGEIEFAIAADSNSLNPYVGQWAGSAYIVANSIYEPLAALTVDGAAQPYLAEGITSSADFKTWTIHLRSDVRFHNDEKLDAAAVATNLEFGRKSALIGAAFAPIESVKAIDDRTVVIAMSSPWSTFAQTLTSQAGYMAAPAMLHAAEPGTADPIGTGPFVFQSHQQDSIVKVKRNPSYWQAGKPLLDAITFKVIPDDLARSASMDAGDLDAMEISTAKVLSQYLDKSAKGDAQLLTDAGLETNEFVMALNTTTEPFNDPIARQALASAIDQDELARTVYEGVWPGAWGNFEEGSPYFISKHDAGYPAVDLDKARQLAGQYAAAHGKPLSFTFMLGTDSQSATLGQTLEQDLAAVGIAMQIDQTEQSTSIARVLGGNYQAGYFAMWSAPTLDKGYFFIATKPAASGISLNHTRLDDPKIVTAMDDARATADQARQVEDYKVVQKQMATNLDRIFLFHSRAATAFDNKVHGFTTATFPGSDERAFAPNITFPLFTTMWIAH